MSATTDRTYKSAWDRWLVFVCGLGSILPVIGLAGAAITEPELSLSGRVLLVIAGLVAPLSVLWMMMTTEYVVESTKLRVRCGPARWHVPFNAIESVKPSRSILSGPSGSLDRLAIKRRGKFDLLISPRERKQFLDHLGTATPHLERRGDALVPPA